MFLQISRNVKILKKICRLNCVASFTKRVQQVFEEKFDINLKRGLKEINSSENISLLQTANAALLVRDIELETKKAEDFLDEPDCTLFALQKQPIKVFFSKTCLHVTRGSISSLKTIGLRFSIRKVH